MLGLSLGKRDQTQHIKKKTGYYVRYSVRGDAGDKKQSRRRVKKTRLVASSSVKEVAGGGAAVEEPTEVLTKVGRKLSLSPAGNFFDKGE